MAVERVSGDVQGQAGLAHPAHTGQRDQTMSLHQRADAGQIVGSPDERRHLDGQVVTRRAQRPDGRERRRAELEQPLGQRQVTQLVGSEIHQLISMQPAEQLLGRQRHENLAAVPGSHEPGGAVDGRPEVIAVTLLDLAAVNAHPHVQQRLRLARREVRLRSLGGVDCVAGPVERRREPVAPVANTYPPWASIASRTTASCTANAARISSARSSHSRVEPSISVKRNVTVPEGRPATRARYSATVPSEPAEPPTLRAVGITTSHATSNCPLIETMCRRRAMR